MKRKLSPPLLWIFAITVLPGITGCTATPPDLSAFSEAIRFLGMCMVGCSAIWAIGIVLFGRSRK